jgi:hypothetical protein
MATSTTSVATTSGPQNDPLPTVQPQKEIAILQFGKVYRGPEARKLLGLPDHSVRVRPGDHQFKIFIQSTSINRKLLAGTQLLVFD